MLTNDEIDRIHNTITAVLKHELTAAESFLSGSQNLAKLANEAGNFAEAESHIFDASHQWDTIHAIVRELNTRGALKDQKDKNGFYYEKYRQDQQEINDEPIVFHLNEEGVDDATEEELAQVLPQDISYYPYPPKPKIGGGNTGSDADFRNDVGRYEYVYDVVDVYGAKEEKTATVLFKTDMHKELLGNYVHRHEKNIAEFHGGAIKGELAPGNSAPIIYARRPLNCDEKAEVDLPMEEENNDVYVGSVFFKNNCIDLYKKLYLVAGIEPPPDRPRGVRSGRGAEWLTPDGKLAFFNETEGDRLKKIWADFYHNHLIYLSLTKRAQSVPPNVLEAEVKYQRLCKHLELEPQPADKLTGKLLLKRIFINGMLSDDKQSCRFECHDQVMVSDIITADFDAHLGNLVVFEVMDSNNQMHEILASIDHGGSMKNIELGANGKLHPHSILRHPGLLWGPTNHIKEYPLALTLRKGFVEELETQARIDLTDTINRANMKTREFYGAKSIIKFANRMSEDTKLNRFITNRNILVPKGTVIPENITNQVTRLSKQHKRLRKYLAKLSANRDIELSKPVPDAAKLQDLDVRINGTTVKYQRTRAQLTALGDEVAARTAKVENEFIKARQKGALRYALEVKLSLCFAYDEYSKKLILNEKHYKLDDVINELLAEDERNQNQDNENYLKAGKFRLRGEVRRSYQLDAQGNMLTIDRVHKLEHRKAMMDMINERIKAILNPDITATQTAKAKPGRDYIDKLPSKSAQVLFFSTANQKMVGSRTPDDHPQSVLHYAHWSKMYRANGEYEKVLHSALTERQVAPQTDASVSLAVTPMRLTATITGYRDRFRLNEVVVNNKKAHYVERYDSKRQCMVSEIVGEHEALDPAVLIANRIAKILPGVDVNDIKKSFYAFVKERHRGQLFSKDIFEEFIKEKFKYATFPSDFIEKLSADYVRGSQQVYENNYGKFIFPSSGLISLALREINGLREVNASVDPSSTKAAVPFSITIVREPFFLWAIKLIVAARNKYVADADKLEFRNKSVYQGIPEPSDEQIEAFIQLFNEPELKKLVEDLMKDAALSKVPLITMPMPGLVPPVT